MQTATRRAGCLLPLLAGGAVAGITVRTVAGIWHACDIGTAPANAPVLLVCFLLLWALTASAWSLILEHLGTRGTAWACAAALCASAAIAWTTIAWIGVLDDYPSPICENNVPSWWPNYIPV